VNINFYISIFLTIGHFLQFYKSTVSCNWYDGNDTTICILRKLVHEHFPNRIGLNFKGL